MRFFGMLFWLVLGGLLAYYYQAFYVNPCVRPLVYSVGEIDPRFGISRAELVNDLKLAETRWENRLQKDVFIYKESGGMPIDMVYDERQAESEKVQALEVRIDGYHQRIEAYNAEVERWNSRGGAPESVYRRLEAERQELNQEVQDINSEIAQLPQREVEQGVYDGQRITIYQFNDAAGLQNILVHEMGHALKLEHSKDPSSVMYYLLSDKPNLPITDDVLQQWNVVCNI